MRDWKKDIAVVLASSAISSGVIIAVFWELVDMESMHRFAFWALCIIVFLLGLLVGWYARKTVESRLEAAIKRREEAERAAAERERINEARRSEFSKLEFTVQKLLCEMADRRNAVSELGYDDAMNILHDFGIAHMVEIVRISPHELKVGLNDEYRDFFERNDDLLRYPRMYHEEDD